MDNYIFKYNFRVCYADTDTGGVVYHSKYLDICERGVYMKKTISIITSLIILTLSLATCVYAREPVMISIQDEKVYAGDEFTVNVFISDNSQISGAVIDINYDNEKLEFISAKEGAILDTKGNISIRNVNKDNSYVRFTYMSGSTSVTAEGIIFSITFKALETASGKTNLEITIPNAADFVNSDLEKLAYSVDNCEITVLDNISIETTEPSTSESPTSTETTTDIIENETSDNTNNDSGEKDNVNIDNSKTLLIVILLVGVALICFGIVFIIKKKK